MSEAKTVTLSADASAAVEDIARKLGLGFEQALGVAIGTQREILNQTSAGNRVSIDKDGKTLRVTIPG